MPIGYGMDITDTYRNTIREEPPSLSDAFLHFSTSFLATQASYESQVRSQFFSHELNHALRILGPVRKNRIQPQIERPFEECFGRLGHYWLNA